MTTNIEELRLLIQSKELLILKFEAGWCNTCRRFDIDLMKVYPLYDGRVELININVDKFPDLMDDYKIHVIPSLVFLKDNKVVSVRNGYVSPDELEKTLKNFLL